MSDQSQSRWDPWTFPTLLLWFVFMLIGLLPEYVFYALREAGYVLTQDAIVNSPYAITVTFSIFIAYFVHQRCLEAGGSVHEACAKAVQTGLAGLLAFLPVPVGLVFYAGDVLHPDLLLMVAMLISAKMLCWLYLLSIPLRYYGLGNRRVCVHMWCVFPSASWPAREETAGDAGEERPGVDESAGDPSVVAAGPLEHRPDPDGG